MYVVTRLHNKTKRIVLFLALYFSLLSNVIRRNYRNAPHRIIYDINVWLFFFVSSNINVFIKKCLKKWINQCWHLEVTKRRTLILTAIENSQRLLIRIATDENIQYIEYYSKLCSVAAMWFDPLTQLAPINKSSFILFRYIEQQVFRDLNYTNFWIRVFFE